MKAIAVAVIISLFGWVPPTFAKDGTDIRTQVTFPEISVPEPAFDFGTVPDGENVVHTYAVENRGGLPLMIMDIKTTCGCTAADYTRGSIPPGGRGEVTLQFNSSGYGGQSVTKIAYIQSNDPNSGKVPIQIMGDVVKVADINPGSINLRGFLGEEVRTVVEITPSEAFPFRIVGEPQAEKGTCRCTIEERGGKYILTAENLVDKPMAFYDSVTLKTDRPEKPEIIIRVFGRITPK